VHNFGPLHEFWTFLFERLNKVLKSYKTNNRNGGELETTFFREFHRTITTSRLVARSTVNDETGVFKSATKAMFSASADDRGTVQALAKELDEAQMDGGFVCIDGRDWHLTVLRFTFVDGIAYSLSPRFTSTQMTSEMYHLVLRYLSALYPAANLRSLNHPSPAPGSVPLPNAAWFFDYVVLQGRRYSSSSRTTNRANSMVQAFVSDRGDTCVGELINIIHIEVNEDHKYVLGHFRWLHPFSELGIDPAQTIWGP
jgi:hypothetical protein